MSKFLCQTACKQILEQIRSHDKLEKKIRELINPELEEFINKLKPKLQEITDYFSSENDAVSILTLGIIVGNVIGDDVCSSITNNIIEFNIEYPELKQQLEDIDEKYLPKC